MITKEFLYNEYFIKLKSAQKIADELGLNRGQIEYLVKKYQIPRKLQSWNRKIEINQKFGHYTVLSKNIDNSYDRRIKWNCLCDCGNIRIISSYDLLKGKTQGCSECYLKKTNKGFGEICGIYWNNCLKSAKKRNIIFDISCEYAWNVFLQQNRKCALTDLPIFFAKKYNKNEQTASLDRIDSDIGYIEGNIQWLNKDVNIMKNEYSQIEFIKICKLIAIKYENLNIS